MKSEERQRKNIKLNVFSVIFLYSNMLNNTPCRGRLWLLNLKDERIKAQRVQYNEFVESVLKN